MLSEFNWLQERVYLSLTGLTSTRTGIATSVNLASSLTSRGREECWREGENQCLIGSESVDNQKALGVLETQIRDSIIQRMKPSEEKVSKVAGEISGLHKTVAVFESRHVETTKSLKEVTVLTERIQTQVNNQGQKMAEQSANDLNRINDRL